MHYILGLFAADLILKSKVLRGIYEFCFRDGRIKIIGGDNIEGLFIFPNKLPFKFLEVYNTLLIYQGD